MTVCTQESHEAAKADEAAWQKLRLVMPQQPFEAGEPWIEQRNCPECGSTLGREYTDLHTRRGEKRVTVSLPERRYGDAAVHHGAGVLEGLPPRVFTHGEATTAREAAVLAYIAAVELDNNLGGGSK